nr:MAG TPA: Transcriptional regulator [Ackermannviridae sp.]
MIQLVNMGDKLRSLRIEKKLTQKQVADRIGLAISDTVGEHGR